MRTFARTTLMTMLVTVAVLAVWSWIRSSSSLGAVSAAPGLHIPSYCVPEELPGIQNLLGRTTNTAGRKLLLAKQQAAEQAARDCAANATAHPPAQKPNSVGLLPTPVPASTVTPQPGVQHAELLPSGDFLPAQDGSNMWVGLVNGRTIEMFAGSVSGPGDNAFQAHPDWAKQPQLHVQGALRVVVSGDELHAKIYAIPGRHGTVHFLTSCGSFLVLQAADNATFTFDAAALAFVNRPTSCSHSTP